MMKHISNSTRFILAVIHLSAGIEENFGGAIIEILKKQYPEMLEEMRQDPNFSENPAATIGSKLVSIARREVQYNEQDAYDVIQDFLTYLVSSGFNFRSKTLKGRPGADNWRRALGNIYANIRTRAMSTSFKKFQKGKYSDEEIFADMLYRRGKNLKGESDGRRVPIRWDDNDDEAFSTLGQKLIKDGINIKNIVPTKLRRKNIRDKSLDEAFGKRPEGGGPSEGGLERLRQSPGTVEGLPTDDKAAKKSFLDTLDDIIPDLRDNLPLTTDGLPAQRLFFDFVFSSDGSGTFLPDIKANMSQATDFKNYLESLSLHGGPDAEPSQKLIDRYSKRWSGFVGDTRLRLMKSIQQFVEEYLPDDEYEKLWEEFFSDVTPKSAEQSQLKGELDQIEYQRGVDLRKIIRMQEREKVGLLPAKDKEALNKLRKRVQKDITDEYKDRVIQWSNYIDRMSEFSDLPLHKQPKFKRPERPKKPLSIDEQLKIVSESDGDMIKREVQEELKKKNPGVETVDESTQGVIASFLRKFYL